MSLWTKRHPRVGVEGTPQNSVRSESRATIDNHRQREVGVDPRIEVFDRARFETRLGEEIEKVRRFGGESVLIFLDLDGLERLNDTHGRRKGDAALALVAQTLRSNVRRIDLVACYGDDEFAVLMPRASLVEARDFFERVRAEVAERSRLALGFIVRLSAGAVRSLNDPGDPRELLETADYAMYLAKRQGKDRLFTTVAVGHKGGQTTGPEP